MDSANGRKDRQRSAYSASIACRSIRSAFASASPTLFSDDARPLRRTADPRHRAENGSGRSSRCSVPPSTRSNKTSRRAAQHRSISAPQNGGMDRSPAKRGGDGQAGTGTILAGRHARLSRGRHAALPTVFRPRRRGVGQSAACPGCARIQRVNENGSNGSPRVKYKDGGATAGETAAELAKRLRATANSPCGACCWSAFSCSPRHDLAPDPANEGERPGRSRRRPPGLSRLLPDTSAIPRRHSRDPGSAVRPEFPSTPRCSRICPSSTSAIKPFTALRGWPRSAGDCGAVAALLKRRPNASVCPLMRRTRVSNCFFSLIVVALISSAECTNYTGV